MGGGPPSKTCEAYPVQCFNRNMKGARRGHPQCGPWWRWVWLLQWPPPPSCQQPRWSCEQPSCSRFSAWRQFGQGVYGVNQRLWFRCLKYPDCAWKHHPGLTAEPTRAFFQVFRSQALRVEAEVKDTLPRAPANRLKGVAAFRKFCLSVDTLPVRGVACAMVEKVLYHIFLKSPDPRQDGSLVYGIKMGACSHAANDAPIFFCRCTFDLGMGLLEAVGDQAKRSPLQCQEMVVSPNIRFKLVGFPGVCRKLENLICFHSAWARHNQQMRDPCTVCILFLLTKMRFFFQIFCSLEFCLCRSSKT